MASRDDKEDIREPWRLKHPALYDFRTHRVLNVLKNKKACQSYGYQDCQHMVVDAFNNAMKI